MYFIYDIYFIRDGRRGKFHLVADVAYFIYTVVRSGVNFNYI